MTLTFVLERRWIQDILGDFKKSNLIGARQIAAQWKWRGCVNQLLSRPARPDLTLRGNEFHGKQSHIHSCQGYFPAWKQRWWFSYSVHVAKATSVEFRSLSNELVQIQDHAKIYNHPFTSLTKQCSLLGRICWRNSDVWLTPCWIPAPECEKYTLKKRRNTIYKIRQILFIKSE